MKPGIKLTIGNKNFDEVDQGMGEWVGNLEQIKKKVGDLTKPFNEISSELIFRIRRRFDDNTFGEPPFPSKTSGFTKKIRQARGYSPDGPKLKASGALKRSINRLASPTKTRGGSQREVLTLRIGSLGVSYAEDQLEGTDWYIPVRVGENAVFIDWDRMPSSPTSNQEYYGNRWTSLSKLPEGEHVIEVPGRNFLALFREDEDFIERTVKEWLIKTLNS